MDDKTLKQLARLSQLKDDSQLVLMEHVDEMEERVNQTVAELKEEFKEIKKEATEDPKIEKVAMRLATKLAALEKGDKGEPGKDGRDGLDGTVIKGLDGINGRDGKDGKDGRDGLDGMDGFTPVKGEDYLTQSDKDEILLDVLSQIPQETPEEVVGKINTSKDKIKPSQIEGLSDIERIAKNNQVGGGITTTFVNGQRAKNITFPTAIVTTGNDTATVTLITVATTAPSNPVVNQLWYDIT